MLHCPSCIVELKIAERQGVEIDYCPDCRGVWLDSGELDKIIERTMQADFNRPTSDGHREDHRSGDGRHYKKKKHYQCQSNYGYPA